MKITNSITENKSLNFNFQVLLSPNTISDLKIIKILNLFQNTCTRTLVYEMNY